MSGKSTKKVFPFLVLLGITSLISVPTKAALDMSNSIESTIEKVLDGAENTIGKVVNAESIKWKWCDDTYYDARSKLICLEQEFILNLSKIGEASVAFVVAHEYAHHIQYHKSELIAKAKRNTMRIELQADCYAGIILASIPNISFDKNDTKDMILAAGLLGDKEFDSHNHHGAGENRALAVRSGLRFGASKGKVKDAYYKMFCLQN